jgi:hypothetical protein
MARSIVRDIHLIGKVDASAGWSGIIAFEVGNYSLVENCLIEAENISTTSDWTWQRNGVIAGVLKGTVRDCVTIKSGHDQMIASIPYGYNNGTDAFATMYNVYTNAPASIAKTFDASGWHEFGMIGSEDVEVISGFGDFSTSLASSFDLDSTIWTLADGAMPHLAHFSDDFVTLAPSVKVTASKTRLPVGETLTLTAELVNSDEVPTWSFEADEGYAAYATITQGETDLHVFTLTGVADGSVSVVIKATIGEEVYSSAATVIEIYTPSGEEPGDYEIPENAVEIGTYEQFKAFFNGSAENTTKNAVLTADIVGDDISRAMGMAGEYTGIFEGQGHTISHYKTNQSLFNIMGTNAQVRNVNLELNHTGSGFGTIAFQNGGSITNCEVTVTIDGAQNTFGGVALVGTSGYFTDCHVNFIINNDQCNTFYPICQNDGGASHITNCSYSIGGTAGNASMFVTSNSNITLIS